MQTRWMATLTPPSTAEGLLGVGGGGFLQPVQAPKTISQKTKDNQQAVLIMLTSN